MIRQAGQVSRACIASIRRVSWLLNARLVLDSRRSRPLHTSPDGPPTAGPADSDPASSDAMPIPPPEQKEDRSPEPGRQQRSQRTVKYGQKGLKTFRGQANQAHSNHDQYRSKKWTYPDNRLRPFRRSLVAQNITGVTFDLAVAQFQSWDREMKIVFDRLNGVDTTPVSETKTEANAEAMETLEKLLRSDTVEDMRSSWLAIPRANRDAEKWLAIMKAAVGSRLERTAMLLEATVETGLTPSWAVEDMFSALVIRHANLPKYSQQGEQTQLPRLLLHLLNNSPPRHYRFQQFAIGMTLSACESDVVADIYSALQAHDHPLHWNTKVKIAGYLTKKTKHKLAALRLFESLFEDHKADIHGRRCAALATELFALPEDWKERRSPVEVKLLAEAFERVIGRGLSPNIITYTAMIRALCLTNQLDAAWQIYDVMRNSGITPDPHVFSILLNGAKRALRLDSAIRVMKEATPDALRMPYIWNDLIHTILLAAVEELPPPSPGKDPIPLPAFPSMLQIYSKFFDLKPLKKLIPAALPDQADEISDWTWKGKLDPVIEQLPVSPPSELAAPGLETLGIMLTGYIKSLPSTKPVMSFYSHFRSLLYNRDALALRLVKHSTLPYDLVLGYITNRPGMINVAFDIVQRMLRDAVGSAVALKQEDLSESDPEEPGPEEPGQSSGLEQEDLPEPDPEEPGQSNGPEDAPSVGSLPAYYHPPPSVFTWTILIHAYASQAHPDKAMRMIPMMRRHGVQPNQVTWHSLLGNYARRQQVAPVMAVLDELERAGYQPTPDTIRAVARLQDHEAILTHLDERAELRDKVRWAEVEAAAVPEPPWPVPLSSKGRGLRRMVRARRMRRQMEKERRALARQAAEAGPRDGEPRDAERGDEGRWPLQPVSNSELDSYLRMYDELVFMRREEKEISSESPEGPVPRRTGDRDWKRPRKRGGSDDSQPFGQRR